MGSTRTKTELAVPDQAWVEHGFRVLSKVNRLLSTEDAWTRRAFARSAGGGETDPCSKQAECWCIMGAILRHAEGEGRDAPFVLWLLGEVEAVIRENRRTPGKDAEDLTEWNDSGEVTFEDVRRVLHIAKERLGTRKRVAGFRTKQGEEEEGKKI